MILATHGVLASSGGVAFLLDAYPNAAAAYSVRKLRATYSGSAIRVRRSSDNTESDIGFTALGNLDTTSLTSFCGAGNGFVTTWYDQSGNARNATQTTAANQPQIVSSGSVIIINSKPSIKFDGINDKMLFTLQWANSTFDFFGVNRVTKTGYQAILAEGNNANGYLGLAYSSRESKFAIFNTGIVDYIFNLIYSTNTQYLNNYYGSITTGVSSTIKLRVNSSIEYSTSGTITSTNSNSIIGSGGTGDPLEGNMQELILYSSDQSSNRTGISTNINSYYAIY